MTVYPAGHPRIREREAEQSIVGVFTDEMRRTGGHSGFDMDLDTLDDYIARLTEARTIKAGIAAAEAAAAREPHPGATA